MHGTERGWSIGQSNTRRTVGFAARAWLKIHTIRPRTGQDCKAMLGLTWKTSKSAFNAGLLTTFGKLDDQDIHDINGNKNRLVKKLVMRYGWQTEAASLKVEKFCASLSDAPHTLKQGNTND